MRDLEENIQSLLIYFIVEKEIMRQLFFLSQADYENFLPKMYDVNVIFAPFVELRSFPRRERFRERRGCCRATNRSKSAQTVGTAAAGGGVALIMCRLGRSEKSWSETRRPAVGAVLDDLPLIRPKAVARDFFQCVRGEYFGRC